MNSNGVQQDKARLRSEARARLKEITREALEDYSRRATDLLVAQESFRRASRILFYLPLRDEMDLRPAAEWALASGKIIALPRYMPEQGAYVAATVPALDNLRSGAFGILEPEQEAPVLSPKQLDFILVPGVAFDLAGRRLGRGKGFYDRLLADVTGQKCGVALDQQVFPALPREPHDVLMNYILTPTRWMTTVEDTA